MTIDVCTDLWVHGQKIIFKYMLRNKIYTDSSRIFATKREVKLAIYIGCKYYQLTQK